MRICSLVPAATEILYALGLGDCVTGVTHECDFPPEAAAKPRLVRPRVDSRAAPEEIDRQVSEMIARGESLYAVDGDLLRSLDPDLIVTQELCHVCAATPEELGSALSRLARQPRVVSLSPRRLADVWNDIRRVGAATGRVGAAESLACSLETKTAAIASRAKAAASRPRVLCLEWLAPFFLGGHWVPEMVALAGGLDVLGRAGEPSTRTPSEQIAGCKAEIIIAMPCGYDLERAADELAEFRFPDDWRDMSALRGSRVYAVNGNAYFSRSGPRLAQGVALLAHLIHPELFPASETPANSFRQIGSFISARRRAGGNRAEC